MKLNSHFTIIIILKEIYAAELKVAGGGGGRKSVPLQRVMVLEVSQYLENYLWPNFDPEAASFEHVMSMVLMINEKVVSSGRMWRLGFAFMIVKTFSRSFFRRFFDLKRFVLSSQSTYCQLVLSWKSIINPNLTWYQIILVVSGLLL
ncbi:hypothetical protein IGI04_016812 [Brassica rapa subsp. trilocularis]|uniref:RNA helicase aquarius N-terminal domain-containing protein n=1 Tax=Brassica rapa subsp. trilocularis TaxID=1813537 RepID=A0ABQ7MWK1_BRACM|nr:hypothetical protein IGI04_016812 [Brassica rapa subsp. trilocularis]